MTNSVENTDITYKDDAEMAKIVFTPSGKRGDFPHGTKVLDAARQLGVDIDSVCGGRGICGRCQVVQSVGDFSKFGIKSQEANLSEFGPKEERYKEKRSMKVGHRLSCSSTIQGDVIIDVPETSQVHKQVVRKRAEVRNIEIIPVVRLYYIEVEEPDMHKPQGDFERICEALKIQWDVEVTTADLKVLQILQKALRDGEWKITAAVRHDGELTYVWAGFHDSALGLAVDVGSTTMSMHLTDLQTGEVKASVGAMNPQIRFGEDLMSRVSYVMMNPGGEEEMKRVVRETLNFLASQAVTEAGLELTDILELVLVGNPIMHHLLLGINPVELGWAPFALSTNSSVKVWASELDIHVNPGARAYILPCVAGHVGADAAAVVLAEGPQLRDEVTLVVDVGTNAEIVLGNKERLLACSSPTGPALEGAQISSGQRAAAGAIERVRIDRETLEPKFKVIGSDLWSDEEGFSDATKKIGITGICGSGIIEVLAEMYLSGLITTDGIVDGTMQERTSRIVANDRTFDYVLHDGEPLIKVTQADVRAIQLAKAALYAGAQLLVDRLEKPVERVVLAGAFGSHIDPKYAMVLGLIPDCKLDMVASVGNAAGTGARIALLNKDARREVERLVQNIEKIETAVEPNFQAHFVEAMAFPHKTASFKNLKQEVTLPEPKIPSGNDREGGNAKGGRRNRRRRRT